MTEITPYLNFKGNARQAMTYYKEALGGELFLQTVGETPMADKCPEGMGEQIMHGSLTGNGFMLMASDMVGPDGYIPGNTMALTLNCSSEADVTNFFAKLANGGRVMDPLREMFWGAIYGCVVDKFGVQWMFNFDKNNTSK